MFAGDDANLSAYLEWQLSTGSKVVTYSFNTTTAEEAAILNNAEEVGGATAFFCADHASQVLNGVGPFGKLGHYFRPGALGSALSKLPTAGIVKWP